MSDGPAKLSPPEAPALDDIILGDDDATAVSPPVVRETSVQKARISVPPPPRPGSIPPLNDAQTRVDAALADDGIRGKNADPRKRAKMTLRIPDDEVSRPQVAPIPTPGVPSVAVTLSTPSRPPSQVAPEERRNDGPSTLSAFDTNAPLQPTRIIAIGPADETLVTPPPKEMPKEPTRTEPPKRAAGLDLSREEGWTPYQPAVIIDEDATLRMNRRDPGFERFATYSGDPRRTIIDGAPEPAPPPPPSEEIPVDLSDAPDEPMTMPRLPVDVVDSEEIRIDDGDRVTDTGEVDEEVEADDLVSVESIPTPHQPPPPPAKGQTQKLPAYGGPPTTATALMAGVAPPQAHAPVPHVPPAQASSPAIVHTPMSAMYPPAAAPVHPPMSAPMHPPMSAPMSSPVYSPMSAGHAPASAPIVPSSPDGAPQSGGGFHSPAVPGILGMKTPSAPPMIATPAAAAPVAVGSQPNLFVPQVTGIAPPPMSEAAANRKKNRPWWEELFNDDFIRTMAKVTDKDIGREVDFIEESLGCEAGATILDLACGTGRHAVELATRGYQVVGFDLSLAMLARASDEAQDRKQKINFVQGDMREMLFEDTFDGIFAWNTSFGFFDEEKNNAVIAKVHRALKKGGQFLLDVVNRDYIVRQAPSLAWFEGDGCICMDEMQIDFITSRMRVKRTLMMDDGRTKEIEYSIRIYALHELGKMLHDNGFRVAEVSGRMGTPGVFFGCESPRTLILAEKR